MLLSFVCDQNAMTVASLVSALGLSHSTTVSCVERLCDVGMLACDVDPGSGEIHGDITPTPVGRAVTRRIHAATDA